MKLFSLVISVFLDDHTVNENKDRVEHEVQQTVQLAATCRRMMGNLQDQKVTER